MIDMAVMEANISRSWQPYQPSIRCLPRWDHRRAPWWTPGVAWHGLTQLQRFKDLPRSTKYQALPNMANSKSEVNFIQFPPFYAERNWATVKTKSIRSQKECAHEEHHSESFWTAISNVKEWVLPQQIGDIKLLRRFLFLRHIFGRECLGVFNWATPAHQPALSTLILFCWFCRSWPCWTVKGMNGLWLFLCDQIDLQLPADLSCFSFGQDIQDGQDAYDVSSSK